VRSSVVGRQSAAEAVTGYLREAAFTTLNRFVALKMLEVRGLVQECISRGEQSVGFKEFTGLAPGLAQLPDHGYRLYIESLFDEIGCEVRVLFDRRDPASLLWPRRQALQQLLDILNDPDLARLTTDNGQPTTIWHEDETIGWVYQYFVTAASWLSATSSSRRATSSNSSPTTRSAASGTKCARARPASSTNATTWCAGQQKSSLPRGNKRRRKTRVSTRI
jgi:hypothetical protein